MKFIRAEYKQRIFWAELSGCNAKVLAQAPYLGLQYTGESYDFSTLKLLAPCEPSKIVAVGKNYRDHALELGSNVPDHPILFIKPETTVNNPFDGIVYPTVSNRVDYEAELALVIGKTAKKVKKADAKDYIFAYTCLNDVTARDIQTEDGQWTRAKSFDGFAPIGPWLVDDIDPSDLKVESRVNGETKQSASTSLFLWNVYELLEFITECMTLKPGDVVTTGTPAGIGPMTVGDTVEIEIENIGILRNKIVEL